MILDIQYKHKGPEQWQKVRKVIVLATYTPEVGISFKDTPALKFIPLRDIRELHITED